VTRQSVANFLQGLCVLPLCVLFGLMVSLLFRWHGVRLALCVGFCALFPIAGAWKTRQHALLAGLLSGCAFTGCVYALWRHSA